MRVRISYSVDLDDVPEECSRMLQEAINKLNEVSDELEGIIDDLNTEKNLNHIIEFSIKNRREKLAKIDSILADNQMILEGYYQAKESKEEEHVDEG